VSGAAVAQEHVARRSSATLVRIREGLIRASPIVALVLIWQAAVSAGLTNPEFLPSPYSIAVATVDLARSGELFSNLWTTLLTTYGGLVIATVVGVPLGFLMAKSKAVDGFFGPLIKATYSLPKSALVPLLFLWFGIGMKTNMTVVVLACLLPLLVYTYHGVHAVPQILIWSAQAMGTPQRKIFMNVVIPASMHAILTGLRIALGFAFVLAVSAEMIAANRGIGKLMVLYGESGAYDYMFAAVVAVVIIAYFSDRALTAFSNYLLRWDEAVHATTGQA
jgi:ABC-type nitrate/sulfonate/bicarbonate transport system permease component